MASPIPNVRAAFGLVLMLRVARDAKWGNKELITNCKQREYTSFSLRLIPLTSLPATIGNVKTRTVRSRSCCSWRWAQFGGELFLGLSPPSLPLAWISKVWTSFFMAWAPVPGWAIFLLAKSPRQEADSSRRRWGSQVVQVQASSLAISELLPLSLVHPYFSFRK